MPSGSSTQIKSTGQSSKSCGCTTDITTGLNPVPPAPLDITPEGFAEQPAAGTTLGGPGGRAMTGDQS